MGFFKWLLQGSSAPFVPDPINNPLAKATTPDEVIAAYIIQSIAKNVDDWTLQRLVFDPWSLRPDQQKKKEAFDKRWKLLSISDENQNSILYNKDESILFSFNADEDWEEGFHVNCVAIGVIEGRNILRSYNEIRSEKLAAERKAEAARRQMEENEKRWNLAEKLLGMKRLPNGALVPKDYDAGDVDCGCIVACDCDVPKGCSFCRDQHNCPRPNSMIIFD